MWTVSLRSATWVKTIVPRGRRRLWFGLSFIQIRGSRCRFDLDEIEKLIDWRANPT